MISVNKYPISRSDIFDLDSLEKIVISLTNEDGLSVRKSVEEIAKIIFCNSKLINLDEDIVNLCEFSSRLGQEVLPREIRVKHYRDDCWVIGARDSVVLIFKENGSNDSTSRIFLSDIRDAAISLYFTGPLRHDERFKRGAELIEAYVTENNLWSYSHTERVMDSIIGIPFKFQKT